MLGVYPNTNIVSFKCGCGSSWLRFTCMVTLNTKPLTWWSAVLNTSTGRTCTRGSAGPEHTEPATINANQSVCRLDSEAEKKHPSCRFMLLTNILSPAWHPTDVTFISFVICITYKCISPPPLCLNGDRSTADLRSLIFHHAAVT